MTENDKIFTNAASQAFVKTSSEYLSSILPDFNKDKLVQPNIKIGEINSEGQTELCIPAFIVYDGNLLEIEAIDNFDFLNTFYTYMYELIPHDQTDLNLN